MGMIFAATRQQRVLAGVASAGLAAWLAYLAHYVPSVSRGDFFLAMMRVDRAFREGHLLEAASWPFHILGGHIVFYQRALQLLNYYVFGYSPSAVKVIGIAAWLLLGLGLWRFVRRLPIGAAAQAGTLLALAVITFNPIAWEVMAWPDATVPYMSALVALLFVLPRLVSILQQPSLSGYRGRLALMCALVIIGSGVGWSIIPTVVWLTVLTAWIEGRRRHLKPAAITAAGALVLAVVLVTVFPRVLRLGLVTESLAALPQNFGAFLSYFFSLFATVVGVHERPAGSWIGAAVFVTSLAVYAAYKWRFRRVSEEELLYVFGVASIALVTLGRWKLNIDRGAAVTYYHLFALPAFYGAIVMALRLVRERAMPWCGAVLAILLGAALAPHLSFYHGNLVQQAESYLNMLPAVRGWRMSEATRLIGSPAHNQDIFLEYLPALKTQERYRRLSRDFHSYQSSRIEPPAVTANPRICSAVYRDLEVFEAKPDVRSPYTNGSPQRRFVRFVGAARDRGSCDRDGVSVSLVDAAGVVQCKSWTTPKVYWHFVSKEHDEILRSPYAFDFSCPAGTGDYFLVSQDASGKVLETVKVLP